MNVSLWAEIRRLSEIEKLSQRAIAQRMKCCQRTVARALRMQHPPDGRRNSPRRSGLDPWKTKIDDLLERSPELSASRIHEEIKRSPDGYRGGITVVRDYVRKVRQRPSRVYQTVDYAPGQAMQVDWGCCGSTCPIIALQL
jgi:transposase